MYVIKMVSKNPLCKFTTNKKGKIESVSGITKEELKKYFPDLQLTFKARLEVQFRINEWKEGKKTLVIEEAYNKDQKRYASPHMLDVIYDISVDWTKPVKVCNMFEGTKEEAEELLDRLATTQLKLVPKDKLKRSREEIFLVKENV